MDQLMRSRIARRAVSLERQRRWWLKRVPEGPLHHYYTAPFVSLKSPSTSVDFLAVDFETTGFRSAADEILSIGFTVIRGHALRMAENQHYLVRPSGAIPESSAIVHGILDDAARGAINLQDALPPLLKALTGRVLLAHHASIEYRFLDHACRQIYGYPFCGPVVDTLELEHRVLRRRDGAIKPGSLRLASLREHYGLPRYRAHNALIDAISAAELLLAQIAHRSNARALRLEEITCAM